MKVYATREMITEYGYMPVRGYHSSLAAAKKQAKELFDKTTKWDAALYSVPSSVSLEMWISLLNGDSISGVIEGESPRDYLIFKKVVFESTALKQHRKSWFDPNTFDYKEQK